MGQKAKGQIKLSPGKGSGTSALALSGKSFALAHVYTAVGVFTVTVQVSDDHVTSTATQTVTVLSQAQAVQIAIAVVDQLSDAGAISHNGAVVLRAHFDAAVRALASGKSTPAIAVLRAALVQLDVLVQNDQLSEADAAPLRTLISRVIASASRP